MRKPTEHKTEPLGKPGARKTADENRRKRLGAGDPPPSGEGVLAVYRERWSPTIQALRDAGRWNDGLFDPAATLRAKAFWAAYKAGGNVPPPGPYPHIGSERLLDFPPVDEPWEPRWRPGGESTKAEHRDAMAQKAGLSPASVSDVVCDDETALQIMTEPLARQKLVAPWAWRNRDWLQARSRVRYPDGYDLNAFKSFHGNLYKSFEKLRWPVLIWQALAPSMDHGSMDHVSDGEAGGAGRGHGLRLALFVDDHRENYASHGGGKIIELVDDVLALVAAVVHERARGSNLRFSEAPGGWFFHIPVKTRATEASIRASRQALMDKLERHYTTEAGVMTVKYPPGWLDRFEPGPNGEDRQSDTFDYEALGMPCRYSWPLLAGFQPWFVAMLKEVFGDPPAWEGRPVQLMRCISGVPGMDAYRFVSPDPEPVIGSLGRAQWFAYADWLPVFDRAWDVARSYGCRLDGCGNRIGALESAAAVAYKDDRRQGIENAE